MDKRKALVVWLLCYGLLFPYLSAMPTQGDLLGGGTVTNTAPTIYSITVTFYNDTGASDDNYRGWWGTNGSTVANDNGVDYIEVTIVFNDTNGESDLKWINLSVNVTLEDGTAWMTHQINQTTEVGNTTDPGFVENTIKVYDPTTDDGSLTAKFKHTFDDGDDPAGTTSSPNTASVATYQWTVTVTDGAGSTATANFFTKVYNWANVTVYQSFYAPNGNVNASDTMWGNWSGSAGSTLTSKNYLKGYSYGTAVAYAQIAWNAPNLTNATNGYNISLTNMNYYAGDASSPATVGTWTAHGSGQQSNDVQLSGDAGATTATWVKHTITIPSNTPTGTYTQTFTWTIVVP